jgi:hypothetical protein
MLGVVIESLRVVIPVQFDGRQALRLRGIADHQQNEHSNAQREEAMQIQDGVPVREYGHRQDRERADQSTTNIVGNVPDGHLRATFPRREPVRHHSAGRRPAHALEPAVQQQ